MKFISQNSFTKKLTYLTIVSFIIIISTFFIVKERILNDNSKDNPIKFTKEESTISDFTQDFKDLGLSLDKYGGLSYYSPSGENFIFTGENKRSDFEYDIWTALYDFKTEHASIIRKDFIYGSPSWNAYGFVFSAKGGLYFYDYLQKSVNQILAGDISYAPLNYDFEKGKTFVSTQEGIKIIGNQGEDFGYVTKVSYDKPIFYDIDKQLLYFARETSDRKENSDPDQVLYYLNLNDFTEKSLINGNETKIVSLKKINDNKLYLRERKSTDILHSIIDIDKNTIEKIGDKGSNVDYWEGLFSISNNCIGKIVDESGNLIREYSLESNGFCDDIKMLSRNSLIYKYKNSQEDSYYIKSVDFTKNSTDELFFSYKTVGEFILSQNRKRIAIPKEDLNAFLFFNI